MRATDTLYDLDPKNRMFEYDAGTPVTFTYNGGDQRIAKDNDTTVTTYLYDFKKVLRENDGTDTVDYTWGLQDEYGDLVSQYRTDGATDESTFYHFDALGSTWDITAPNQDVDRSYRYMAFGEQVNTSGGTPENTYTFVGKQGYYNDSEIDHLYALGRRWEDHSTGQFTSRDPARADNNLYRYVHNNPVNATDPSGLEERPKIYSVDWLKNRLLRQMNMLSYTMVSNDGTIDSKSASDLQKAAQQLRILTEYIEVTKLVVPDANLTRNYNFHEKRVITMLKEAGLERGAEWISGGTTDPWGNFSGMPTSRPPSLVGILGYADLVGAGFAETSLVRVETRRIYRFEKQRWEIIAPYSAKRFELEVQRAAKQEEQMLDNVQTVLDVGGFVPVIGDILDVANAGISLSRGNYAEAGFGLIAAIPVVGSFIGVGGKYALKAARRSDDVVDVGTAVVKNVPGGVVDDLISPSFRRPTDVGLDLSRGDKSVGGLGREGEALATRITGAPQNTQSFVVNGRTRIPDQVLAVDIRTRLPSILGEVKNLDRTKLSLTRQLLDDVDLVGPGGQVRVLLPPTARVTRPLQRAFSDPLNPLRRVDLR